MEEAVRRKAKANDPEPSPSANSLRAPGLLELEELLSERLDTRVKVTMGAKRGRIAIEFATLEDLERIYRAMSTVAQDTTSKPED